MSGTSGNLQDVPGTLGNTASVVQGWLDPHNLGVSKEPAAENPNQTAHKPAAGRVLKGPTCSKQSANDEPVESKIA
jgi:hypothetical protein